MSDTLIADATRRVRDGAALLDRLLPGWHDVVDVDSLWINSPCNCVLGQLGLRDDVVELDGDYWQARQQAMVLVEGREGTVDELRGWAGTYGFDEAIGLTGDPTAEMDALDRAWREEIRSRQEGSVDSPPASG